ncbi:GGDEF domain-containing protein [Sedimenticola sp.]|uniref:GGDEF domain-containing protein n=1 Tax=Sedimenticola sp. TaxID=1940285 RepID=UPI003D141DFA
MKKTDQTLLDQMRITDLEIDYRKKLFMITDQDVQALKRAKPLVEAHLDTLVASFYEMQTNIPEIALLIGDADTLARLQNAQSRYIIDLFSGLYDLEYVNNRLRIGLVHKRIGVEPTLYLSAIYTLKGLLNDLVRQETPKGEEYRSVIDALEKLILFDVTLVFDTYIRSLLSEIEIAKEKAEHYALELEEKVKQRTQQLEEMSRTDALTGLLNVRHLNDTLTRCLRAAQRRSEPVSIVYIDINDFKLINDTEGHQRGDEVLRLLGAAVKRVARKEDVCFRYGGDELCIVLPNCQEHDAQEIYITRLKAELGQQLDNLSLSTGVVQTGPDDYVEAEALIREADKRMYEVKKQSKLQATIQPLDG